MAPSERPMWDQPRIARELNVQTDTARQWRKSTLAALREWARIDGEAFDPHDLEQHRRLLGRKVAGEPARLLPSNALPLPDLLVGDKPVWVPGPGSALETWARQTGRRTADGGVAVVKPPGRTPGIKETRPRRGIVGRTSAALA